ncbi:hypothetical protein LCGC14_2262940 [marine sediment metagenome]|uniref:Uncharacterized protein n=1 Tax=marine sediment metagenome TaxID=412755 RepID=A0A0F9DLH4_9ZZZZ|nr:hypothetical protein [Desulfobacterales bacterium]
MDTKIIDGEAYLRISDLREKAMKMRGRMMAALSVEDGEKAVLRKIDIDTALQNFLALLDDHIADVGKKVKMYKRETRYFDSAGNYLYNEFKDSPDTRKGEQRQETEEVKRLVTWPMEFSGWIFRIGDDFIKDRRIKERRVPKLIDGGAATPPMRYT